MSVNHYDIEVFIDNDGLLSYMNTSFGLSMEVIIQGQSVSMNCDYSLLCTVNAVGSDVVINFPDFSDYVAE